MHNLTKMRATRIVSDLHKLGGEVDLFVYYHSGISSNEMEALEEVNLRGLVDIYSDDGEAVYLALSNRWKELNGKKISREEAANLAAD